MDWIWGRRLWFTFDFQPNAIEFETVRLLYGFLLGALFEVAQTLVFKAFQSDILPACINLEARQRQ